jgi:hypothetical protein
MTKVPQGVYLWQTPYFMVGKNMCSLGMGYIKALVLKNGGKR